MRRLDSGRIEADVLCNLADHFSSVCVRKAVLAFSSDCIDSHALAREVSGVSAVYLRFLDVGSRVLIISRRKEEMVFRSPSAASSAALTEGSAVSGIVCGKELIVMTAFCSFILEFRKESKAACSDDQLVI